MVNSGLFIRPGLSRIRQLSEGVTFPWKPVHVAGTNGKGSICAYLTAMLNACEISTGRFTSPHLIDRWDCITINQKPVSEHIFRRVEDKFKRKNDELDIGATSFEVLTATAFQIFSQSGVKVGVVECGMGGRLDATNVLEHPMVTVISQLGMDHEAFLGDSPAKIAFEKAGIIKEGVPCVVSSTSANPFIEEVVKAAEGRNAPLYFTPLPAIATDKPLIPHANLPNDYEDLFKNMGRRPNRVMRGNMWCAWRAFKLIEERLLLQDIDDEKMIQVMSETQFPGRYQHLSLEKLTGRKTPALLDGAHNLDAWKELLLDIRATDQPQNIPIVWVLASSNGRDPTQLLKLIQPHDKVIVVEFGQVDGMPWVKPVPADNYKPIQQGQSNWINMGSDVHGALQRACNKAEEGPLIITGSLYLVSDVLRLVRDAGRNVHSVTTQTQAAMEPGEIKLEAHNSHQVPQSMDNEDSPINEQLLANSVSGEVFPARLNLRPSPTHRTKHLKNDEFTMRINPVFTNESSNSESKQSKENSANPKSDAPSTTQKDLTRNQKVRMFRPLSNSLIPEDYQKSLIKFHTSSTYELPEKETPKVSIPVSIPAPVSLAKWKRQRKRLVFRKMVWKTTNPKDSSFAGKTTTEKLTGQGQHIHRFQKSIDNAATTTAYTDDMGLTPVELDLDARSDTTQQSYNPRQHSSSLRITKFHADPLPTANQNPPSSIESPPINSDMTLTRLIRKHTLRPPPTIIRPYHPWRDTYIKRYELAKPRPSRVLKVISELRSEKAARTGEK